MRLDQHLNSAGTGAVDYKVLGEHVRDSYRDAAAQYRRDDEIEITTGTHQRLSGILGSLTASFGRPIDVLDVGCGTGRYFHCLKNVRHLDGLDVSQEMLNIARRPVQHEQVTIEKINLHCENAFLAKFAPGSFDFIYSLGMFGNGCPVTVEICDRFYDWLAPGGQLFFNAISIATMPFSRRWRRNIRRQVYPFLPRSLKRIIDAREAGVPFFALSEKELRAIMRSSHFNQFTVTSNPCRSQLWNGVHLECHTRKPRN